MLRISPEAVRGSDTTVRESDQTPGDIAYAALIAHYGTVKEAAFALGQVDPSLMRREIEACKFERLMRRDRSAFMAVLDAINAAFAQQVDPFVRMQQVIALVRAYLNELEQGVQFARHQRVS